MTKRIKNLGLAALFLAINFVALAQTGLRGEVISSDGEAVSGAVIKEVNNLFAACHISSHKLTVCAHVYYRAILYHFLYCHDFCFLDLFTILLIKSKAKPPISAP